MAELTLVSDVRRAADLQFVVAEVEARKRKYTLQGYGDCVDLPGMEKPMEFDSLNAALFYLERWAVTCDDGEIYNKLDIEDDRVVIFDEHKNIVWRFSGWHWMNDDSLPVEQGSFIGHEKTVYEECAENY